MHPRTQRGQAIILVALSIPVIFGLLGLVVDCGWAYWREEACKTAAQSAAIASAMAATKAANLTCGSGVACTSTRTACPASPSTPPSNNLQNGCLFAKANGFTAGGNGGRQNVTYTANTTGSPAPGVTPAYWVRFVVTERIPTLFSAILGQSGMLVSALATGGAFASSNGGCIFVLDQTASKAYQQTSSTVATSCGLYDDSNASDSVSVTSSTLQFNGGASLTTDGGVSSVSSTIQYSGGGSQKTNQPRHGDPFTGLVPPTPAASCTADPHITSISTSVNPGTYCGLSITSSTVTFKSGIYIFKTGSLNITSSSVNASSGVTFYFTNAAGNVNFTSGSFTIKALSGGPTDGIAFWKDGPTISTCNITSSGMTLTGVVYMPYTHLTYTSSSSTAQTIVADTLKITSASISGTAPSSFLTNGGGAAGGAYLIQ